MLNDEIDKHSVVFVRRGVTHGMYFVGDGGSTAMFVCSTHTTDWYYTDFIFYRTLIKVKNVLVSGCI